MLLELPRRIVYVVVTEGRDIHTAMARVSIASVRLTHPSARVTVVCDPASDRAVHAHGDPICAEADDWIVLEVPPRDPVFRNRFLKTRLRLELQGSFLYLDGDTFVRDSLDPIFQVPTDIAAAANHSSDRIPDQIWEEDAEASARLGWSVGDRTYVNGGVIFFADTDGARRFGAAYHELWTTSVESIHRSLDQASLNAAIGQSRPTFTLLPHRFNAQFRTNLAVGRDAAILHDFASDPGPPSAARLLATRLVAGGSLREQEIQRMIRANHPWRSDDFMDEWVAARIARKGRIVDADELWLRGKRIAGLRTRVASAALEIARRTRLGPHQPD